MDKGNIKPPDTTKWLRLEKEFKARIMVLDGAQGTWFQAENLTAADYEGSIIEAAKKEGITHTAFPQRGNHDMLNVSRPDVVAKMHYAYLCAGANIISTNTFNSNSISQSDYKTEDFVPCLNREAVKLAKAAVEKYQSSELYLKSEKRALFVAGSIGPTSKTLSLSRDVENPASRAIDFDTLSAAYELQISALVDAGADILLIETVFDSLNARAAVAAAERACEAKNLIVPVMVSSTIADRSGRTLSGQTLEAFAASIRSPLLFSLGLNCSFGAKDLIPYVKRLSESQPYLVGVHPNAGLPDVFGQYTETPETTSDLLGELISGGLVNYVGGCCGTRPAHIKALADRTKTGAPRPVPKKDGELLLAGLEAKAVTRENNFLNIGERNNVAGSAKFSRLIREKKYNEALSIAREQVENGAQVIDINLDDGLLDIKYEMVNFLRLMASDPDIARVPVMVDSSDFEVLLAGLKAIQGKNIANSISLKSGEKIFLEHAKEIKRLGAAVVVMAFDENGQADTFERKIAICSRAYALLTQRVGFPPEDIIFDPNILSVATGLTEHDSYGLDFIRACKWIKENLPGSKVSGGVSNLSFSFRGNQRIREAMHAVFLYHAVQAGMDMGIVNAGLLQPYEEVETELRDLCEDVVLNRRSDAADRLLKNALSSEQTGDKGKDPENSANTFKSQGWREESAETRLIHSLVKGIDDFVEEDVLEALPKQPSALALIENVLMSGMKNVGDRFAEGKMFLPQVIRSARVMKKAVAVLMPFIEAENSGVASRAGTVLLATVVGDVHDIGKNIVGVVLACNNFEIIDLGVMVSKELIASKAREHRVDIIGCSGLITPSLEEMLQLAAYLETEGLTLPLIVGGAATSKAHTALKIAPRYSHGVVHCLDASKSVEVASILCDTNRKGAFLAQIAEAYKELAERVTQLTEEPITLEAARENRLLDGYESRPFPPHQFGTFILNEVGVSTLRHFINWDFYFKAWEMQGATEKLINDVEKGAEARRLLRDANEILNTWEDEFDIGIRGAFGILPAKARQEDVLVFENEIDAAQDKVYKEIHFPRQTSKKANPHLSLADYIMPLESEKHDWLGMFAVTAGLFVDGRIEAYKAKGDDYNAIMTRLLCDRLAEAYAEWLHLQIRVKYWGFASNEKLSTEELFHEKYQGIRPAPGYPACPDHALKRVILDVVDPNEELGIKLTDSDMLVPSSSVCGFVFASDKAKYFDARVGK